MNTFLKFIIIAVLACSPLLCLAKSDSAKVAEFARENFIDKQALNVSYRLGLPDEKRLQFIKLYSEYLKQMMEMPVVSRPAGASTLSEADYDRMNKLEIERSRKIVELRNAYDSKFMKVLSAKQLYRLHEMERSDIKRMKALDRKQKIKSNESKRKARESARKTRLAKRKAATKQRQAAAKQRKAAAKQREAAAQISEAEREHRNSVALD